MRILAIVALVSASTIAQEVRKIDVSKLGPRVGTSVPDFSLVDQHGKRQTPGTTNYSVVSVRVESKQRTLRTDIGNPRRRHGRLRSRISFRRRRSLRLARRMAVAMNGANSFENPVGSPRLRNVMRVLFASVDVHT